MIIWKQNNEPKGGIWTNKFLNQKVNLDNFEKGQGATYAVVTRVVTTAQLGKEERQLQVVARVKLLKNPAMCHPYCNGKNDDDEGGDG